MKHKNALIIMEEEDLIKQRKVKKIKHMTVYIAHDSFVTVLGVSFSFEKAKSFFPFANRFATTASEDKFLWIVMQDNTQIGTIQEFEVS